MNFSRSFAICVIAVLVIVGVWALLHQGTLRPQTVVPLQDVKAQEAYWQQRIEKVGAVQAYAELKTQAAGLDPSTQHGLAHSFGGALYRAAGLPGLSVCDASFTYGCFHEFIGQAISALGPSIIPRLNEQCLSAPSVTACQHGIGHGVLAYLGYDADNLSHAVSICTGLSNGNYIDGCDAGAFMEYNLHTMLAQDAPPRSVGPKGWFAPCDSFSDLAKESCVFLLPQWWWTILPGRHAADLKPMFKRMGDMCITFTDPSLRRYCFEGLGQMAPTAADYKGAGAATLCKAATSILSDQLFCVSYAASLLADVSTQANGSDACSYLNGEEQVYCEAYARGNANLHHELPLPTSLQ